MFDKTKVFVIQIWTKADIQPIFGKLGGRSWLLILFFALTAFWLEYHGKLTADYAAVITALSGFHVGRAVMQDYNDRNKRNNDDKS